MSDEKKSSWNEPRHAKFTHEEDVAFLRRAIEVSRRSREHGNTPFGAILVNEDKQIVLEQENRELRRANDLLKRASAFFAAELDRPGQ